MKNTILTLNGKEYTVGLQKTAHESVADVPVLCIVSYLPNKAAINLIRIAVESIRKYTTTPYSLWVVDNASPPEHLSWLRQQTDLTLIENRTAPQGGGSYANAIALQICTALIPKDTTYLMTLHQDILVCKKGWLEFLLSKFTNTVRAVGVREDTSRVKDGILHVLGYIIDFQLFQKLKLNFYPNLPDFDVGDLAIVGLKKAGFNYYATPNSLHRSAFSATLPEPFCSFGFDRSVDDQGDVFFMHLGRGSLKSESDFQHEERKSLQIWSQFAVEHLGVFPLLVTNPKPFWPKPRTYTFRRWYLDACMQGISWYGKVLDIGGKRNNTRGTFRPPLETVDSWEYVNISPESQPDYLASADNLPLDDAKFDMVLLAEVLEHLPKPEKSLAEAARVLKPLGHLVLAAPFINTLHPDPQDFQRWLPAKYTQVLTELGFIDIQIRPMGGLFAVAYDLYYAASNFSMQQVNKKTRFLRKIMPLLHKLCMVLEKKYPGREPGFASFITTGYCVCARKKDFK